jgi:hypothetical protein
MTRSRRRVAVIALSGLVLAGCDSKGPPSKPTLSAHELARRANAICARYRIAYRGGRSLKTREEVLRYLDRTRPLQRRQERELRALHPPKELRSAVEHLLDDAHKAQVLLNHLRTAVASRDGNRQIEIMRQLGIHTRRDRKELRSLGWTVCASPPE